MKRFKKALSGRKDLDEGGGSQPDDPDDTSLKGSLLPEYHVFSDNTPNAPKSPAFPSRTSSRRYAKVSVSSQRSQGGSQEPGRDPFGLNVIYVPGQAHKLDIIFVHGLGGTSRMTWSRGKDLDYFWPQVFLPNEPGIRDARISTFGYNSSVFHGSGRTKVSILDFAKGLLFDLKYATDDEGENMDIGSTPIIFVVHSMGGLIVKMAYMQGLYDPGYKHIVSSISSIIFLATPHRGSDFAETLNKVLKATMISAPKQFINDLGKNSSALLKLNEEFRHFAPNISLASFYETRATSIGTDKYQIMVVNPDSATLGYPGETSAAMDADHHTVCKYESPKDPNYVKVRNYIKSRISDILKSQKLRKSPLILTDDGLEEGKLEQFFGLSDSSNSDFIFFKDRCLQGTCTWILENTTFLGWLNDVTSKPRVLWLQGGPGTGKSITTSYIIDHLVKLKFDCQYFFIRFGDHKKRSLSNLLRSLALQIAQSSTSYRKKILRLSDEAANVRKADAQNIWQRLFRDILFKIDFTTPMYWVIDGLDECDTPKRLIKMISEISTVALPIRVMIVSRKQRDISAEFNRLDGQVTLDRISSDGRVEDFERYVDFELDVPGPIKYREQVAKQIVKGAFGNFLWVHLAVKKINVCQTTAKRQQALEQLPPGMDKFFDRMAQSIADIEDEDNKNLASDILAWATCSLRGLTLSELLQALNLKESEMPDLQRSIEDLCAGFIVVDNRGNISLIHKTAREYLIAPQNRPFSIDHERVNEKIFMRCVKCISAVGLRAKIRRGTAPEFLDYAITFWFAHLTTSSPDSQLLLTTLSRFLRTNAIMTWIQALATVQKIRILIRASTYLSIYAAKRKESEWDTMSRDLQIAEREMIEAWAIDLIKIVGKFGSNLVQNPESIYKLIPPFCPPESSVYQLFVAKENWSLAISGLSTTVWDDSLGRLQFGADIYVSVILTVGNLIAALVPSGTILLFHATTFEKIGQLDHEERISKMQRSSSGTMLVTYGYATTKIWDVVSRHCTLCISNPASRPKAHCLAFMDDDETLLLGGDDRIVRTLSLNESFPTWEVVVELGEEKIEGAIVNSPTTVTISPDGQLIFFGYRAHPISVWTIDGEHVGVSFRNGSQHLKGRTMSTDCMQAMWHPHASAYQVLGIYEDGTVFRWNPIDEEYCELAANASNLAVSHDGNFLATGDSAGRVKLYNTDLELVYQLRSKDSIYNLTFSPDANRLYDVCGPYGNVWEPSALMRISEQTERGSDSAASETDSMVAAKSTISEVVAKRLDPITAVAGQSRGRLYCCGTEAGNTELFDVSLGKVSLVEKSVGYFTTERIVWSLDGRNIAYSSINMVTLKTVLLGEDKKSWRTESIIPQKIKLGGAVKEMLFDTESSKLLVCTTFGVDVISLVEKKVVTSRKLNGSVPRWINHPSDSALLLAISPNTINVLDWDTLSDIRTFNFTSSNYFSDTTAPTVPTDSSSSPTNLEESVKSQRKSSQATTGQWKLHETVERVLVTQDRLYILVQISIPINKDNQGKRLLLFDVTTLKINQNDGSFLPAETNPLISPNISPPDTTILGIQTLTMQDPAAVELHPIPLPQDIASHINIPVSFISGSSRERDKLIFLDQSYWLCSWRLSLPNDALRRKASGDSNTKIVQHYFLPGDWISPDCIALATIMDDGILLIPRNGETAVVRCDTVRT